MASGEAWVPVEVGEVLAEMNNGHGDCLFVAISSQLDGQFSPLALREMAVHYLEEHREQFMDELLSLGWDMLETGEIAFALDGDLLVDAVLQVLAIPTTWGGAECIAALGLVLERVIRVYQEQGPTIIFPLGEDVDRALRILLRYPRGAGQRRTHYESVVAWRHQNPRSSAQAATREICTQTGQETDSRQEDQNVGTDAAAAAVSTSASSPPCHDSPDVPAQPSTMVLRPRARMPFAESAVRREDFSDEEEASAEERDNVVTNKYRICIACKRNIGRYTLIPCGDFPICGRCLRTWYVNIKGTPCVQCGKEVWGWGKVLNNN